MATVLLVTAAESKRTLVISWLEEAGVQADSLDDSAGLVDVPPERAPRLLMLDVASLSPGQLEVALEQSQMWRVPVLGLLAPDDLTNHRLLQRLDDFTLEPARPLEVVGRARRLLRRGETNEGRHLIQVGDLTIDTEKYEVRVAGVLKLLTYKEYELLRLLASNPGRVFTREELLSRVWGYDYFGGTRTVDVHIRRLRAKIEDVQHPFVETIWNVGYRFKAVGS